MEQEKPKELSSTGFLVEDLVAEQNKDRDLEILLKWIRIKEEPTQKTL